MPLYEFYCPRGHEFEKFYRSIGAAQSQEKCPECGAMAARRISAAGLVFKGSGFYITDYGKDGRKAEREQATAKATAAAEPVAGSEGKAPAGESAATKPSENAAPSKPSGSSPDSTAAAPSTKTSGSSKKTE